MHRFNSDERQHYLIGSHYSFRLRPNLVYAGRLSKQAGWREEPHTHSFTEILFVTDGKGHATVKGEDRTVGKGDILIYNANAVHQEFSSDSDPMEVFFFAVDKFNITDLEPNCLLPERYDFVVHSGDMYEVFEETARTLVHEMERKERFYQEIAKNAARAFIMYLFRLLNRTDSNIAIGKSEVCSTAMAYIDDHFTEPLTLDDIAGACYVSKYYLSHIFAKEAKMSIFQYIAKRRVDEATRLLASGSLPINEIAEMCGYSDFSYFCHSFKKAVGQTPMQYRKASARAHL